MFLNLVREAGVRVFPLREIIGRSKVARQTAGDCKSRKQDGCPGYTANNEPTVRLALSDDAANTFYSPIDVAINKPKGRVDVALLEDQSTIVS